jgi:hypothetical protein
MPCVLKGAGQDATVGQVDFKVVVRHASDGLSGTRAYVAEIESQVVRRPYRWSYDALTCSDVFLRIWADILKGSFNVLGIAERPGEDHGSLRCDSNAILVVSSCSAHAGDARRRCTSSGEVALRVTQTRGPRICKPLSGGRVSPFELPSPQWSMSSSLGSSCRRWLGRERA